MFASEYAELILKSIQDNGGDYDMGIDKDYEYLVNIIRSGFSDRNLKLEKLKSKLSKLQEECDVLKGEINELDELEYNKNNPVSLYTFIHNEFNDLDNEYYIGSYSIEDSIVIDPRIIIYGDEEDDEEYYSEIEVQELGLNKKELYEEVLDFENFDIEKVNLDTNTLTIVAGGDWQGLFRFTVTLVSMKGKFRHNNDARRLKDSDEVKELSEEEILKIFNLK